MYFLQCNEVIQTTCLGKGVIFLTIQVSSLWTFYLLSDLSEEHCTVVDLSLGMTVSLQKCMRQHIRRKQLFWYQATDL